MRHHWLTFAVMTFAMTLIASTVRASSLVDNLQAGRPQTVVVYGTSLTAIGGWVNQVGQWLGAKYSGKLTLINSGMSGKSSVDGIANLTSKVINYQPDTVFIEFAVNDAYTPYSITPAQSKTNLNSMIDSILGSKPGTEIILQTMNSAWGTQASLRPDLANYYQGYRDVAGQRGLLLIDNYPNWVALQTNQPATYLSYVPDQIHPNDAGCAAITTPAIETALLPEPASLGLLATSGLFLLRRRTDKEDRYRGHRELSAR